MDCKSWISLFALDCLHDWQDFWAGILAFAAGLLGFLAAIWAVRRTLQSEHRKTCQELDALKKGLGAEIRHFARGAYDGAIGLKAKLDAGQLIQIIDVENATQFPSPSVYSGNTTSLGLLGEQTPEIVLFYNKIEIIEKASRRLRADIDALLSGGSVSYAIGRGQLTAVVKPLLDACETAVRVLPYLKTGTLLDINDGVFPQKVAALVEGWNSTNST